MYFPSATCKIANLLNEQNLKRKHPPNHPTTFLILGNSPLGLLSALLIYYLF